MLSKSECKDSAVGIGIGVGVLMIALAGTAFYSLFSHNNLRFETDSILACCPTVLSLMGGIGIGLIAGGVAYLSLVSHYKKKYYLKGYMDSCSYDLTTDETLNCSVSLGIGTGLMTGFTLGLVFYLNCLFYTVNFISPSAIFIAILMTVGSSVLATNIYYLWIGRYNGVT